jgi:two-component system, chemotaxis family, protein-glutamate methylesterase/glutaminase
MEQEIQGKPPVKLLIADDSWVLRKVLRGTLSSRNDVEIVGEATNGIHALELVLKTEPDVILLDMEMPTMDGMTTLQHLMIHRPTPTIMLSALSRKGTARCFDALKYGSVDFVSKNSFFKGLDGGSHSKFVLKKIYDASKTKVQSIDPMQRVSEIEALINKFEKIVFCEECGTRQRVKHSLSVNGIVKCNNCGDEILLHMDKRYRRMNYLTVIGAGASGYANLLKIIPELNPEMGGALCIMILDKSQYVQSFVKYLNAICDFDVVYGENGTPLEGGCCYLFSAEKHVRLSPYSGQYSLKMDKEGVVENMGAIDSLMISASSIMKTRTTGILLSGSSSDGSIGMANILKEKGNCFVLNPSYCLHKTMVNGSVERHHFQANLDEFGLAIEIQKCHFTNKVKVVTA